MSRLVFAAAKGFGSLASCEAKSKSNGKTKPLNVNFDILAEPMGSLFLPLLFLWLIGCAGLQEAKNLGREVVRASQYDLELVRVR
jgi:hypothetical protein